MFGSGSLRIVKQLGLSFSETQISLAEFWIMCNHLHPYIMLDDARELLGVLNYQVSTTLSMHNFGAVLTALALKEMTSYPQRCREASAPSEEVR